MKPTPTPTLTFLEAKVTIELATPLHIGSGEAEAGSDAGIVRDFNGLPGVPGSSLQGILRAAVAATDERQARDIFGYAANTQNERDGLKKNGIGGRLWVSWGVIHNCKNKPQNEPVPAADRDNDEVLRDAARPMLRDHVRLNHRGVAADFAKFDELVVSAGHRFTFTLRLATAGQADHDAWNKLLALLKSGLRLGGKSKRGLGAFKVISVDPPLASPIPDPRQQAVDHLFFDLEPESLWMFGGGFSEDTDSAPVKGKRVEWSGTTLDDVGSIRDGWVLPGSAIKGALAHRTCFHANLACGKFADKLTEAQIEKVTGENNPCVRTLFGHVDENSATAGKVFVDDIFIPIGDAPQAPPQQHVSINPFTGGAKDTALFNDQPLFALSNPQKAITLRISISGVERESVERRAFDAAINDLLKGRLPLGAHVGRGYGVFNGQSETTA